MTGEQVADAREPEQTVEHIVRRALSRDPSLAEATAEHFARRSLEFVAAGVAADDAPEIARRLLDLGDGDPSAATIVAAAASEVLAEAAG